MLMLLVSLVPALQVVAVAADAEFTVIAPPSLDDDVDVVVIAIVVLKDEEI